MSPVRRGVTRQSDDTNALCRFWISDEYGPYIYRFDGSGRLVQTIQPPQAILPESSKGNIDFTSDDDPDTGRAGNQGMTLVFCDH